MFVDAFARSDIFGHPQARTPRSPITLAKKHLARARSCFYATKFIHSRHRADTFIHAGLNSKWKIAVCWFQEVCESWQLSRDVLSPITPSRWSMTVTAPSQ